MVAKLDNHMGAYATVLINPTASEASYTLNGDWSLVCDGTKAGAESLGTFTGSVNAPAMTVTVYVK